MYQTIRYEKKDGIGIATINRPEALNALNSTVVSELEQVIGEVEKDQELGAMILTGEGRSFVAGGGPAGLTAALYAVRAGRSVLVLEEAAPGGQINFSPLVENYPGLPGVSGLQLSEALTRQAEEQGVELDYAQVLGFRPEEGGFAVETDGGPLHCRALILAPGTRHRPLGLEGEEALTGQGVSYCAVCDGPFYQGRDTAIVGGGDTALQEALFLSGVCQGPKDIPETVAQAGAAAVKAIGLLAKDKLMTNPCTAKADELLCNGCSQCENVCPYGAISYETKLINDHGVREERRIAVVNNALCQGCGACTVTCPSGAMDLQGFSNRQILAEVDAICR